MGITHLLFMVTCILTYKTGICITLDIGCSSTTSNRKIMKWMKYKPVVPLEWSTQSGSFMTTPKFKADFCLLEFSVMTFLMWKYHLYNSTEGCYGVIIVGDLPASLIIDIILFDKNISCGGYHNRDTYTPW